MNKYKLMDAIESAGFKTTDFHKKLGLSYSQWYKRLKGIVGFNQGEIKKIVDLLHLTPESVFDIFFALEVS